MAKVHDSFVAEDLVQETLLAAYASHHKFSGKSTLKTWLTGIMKHKLQDYYRKLKPEQNEQSLDNMFDERGKWKVKPGDWGYDPQSLLEQKELMAIVSSCFSDMPSRTSLVYKMRELEGVTTRDISSRLQIEDNNCWVIIHRARMMLRNCLEKNWFNQGGNRY